MEKTILGLSFSTRMLGLVVFKSNSIVDYSLKLHKGIWSPQKLDLVLASLASCINYYAITDVALSIPDRYHQTKDFKELQQEVEKFAQGNGFEIAHYSLKEVYQRFGSPIRRTRNGLMKRLVLLYPELSHYYERELTNKNKYYVKLFEAIAVAGFHSQQNKQQSYEEQG